MKPTWRCCNCSEGCKEHAHITATDMDTGDRFDLRVPHAHRETSVGWGDGDRYHFGEGSFGRLVASGHHGLTVTDEGGKLHRVRHGGYRMHRHRGEKGVTAGSIGTMVPESLGPKTQRAVVHGYSGGSAEDQKRNQARLEAMEKAETRVRPHARKGRPVRGHQRKFSPAPAPEACGDCYEANGRHLLFERRDDPSLTLVHGEVTGTGQLDGVNFGHAWIERGDTVLDFSSGRRLEIPKEVYYQLGRVAQNNNTHRYTANDAAARVDESGTWGPWDFRLSMEKAKLKTGQRWITVHPNGKDEKGVPILIQEAGDGSHRVVGGAGGKLTHLRLHNVKSKEEHAEAAKERGKEKRTKERERKEAQTTTEATTEVESKADVKADKLHAERKFITKIRESGGGVDEDLDEGGLAGMSDGARNLIKSRHHAKLLRQAKERRDEALKQIVDDRAQKAEDKAELEREIIKQVPDVAPEVMELVDLELARIEEDQREVRAEKRARKVRVTAGQTRVGEHAVKALDDGIDSAAEQLSDKQGRERLEGQSAAEFAKEQITELANKLVSAEGEKKPHEHYTASDELQRRSMEALRDADLLHSLAADSEVPEDLEADADTARYHAFKRAGITEDSSDDDRKDVLRREAARQLRRAEISDARSDKMRDMAAEKGEHVAQSALRLTDATSRLAGEASEAKKLGLTSSEQTPLKEPEIEEIMEMLEAGEELRQKQKAFRTLNKAAEEGAYDRTRRAFDLRVSGGVEDRVVLDIEDEVRRQLTERLLGVSSPRHGTHIQAVANGHYHSLADVSLGIAGQRYVDRQVVDGIGLKNAAVLMRHAMEQDGHFRDDVLEAIEEHHVGELNKITSDALALAEEYVPGLAESVEGVTDIERTLTRLDVHDDALNEAQRTIGAAIGRMEATATAAQVFRQTPPSELTIDTGGNNNTSLQWAHSLGLEPGDYHLDYTNQKLVVPQKSWNKLIRRDSAEVMQRRTETNAIKAGDHDEDGWLPAGFAYRPKNTFSDPVPGAAEFSEPLSLNQDTVDAPTGGGLFASGGPAPSVAPTAADKLDRIRTNVTDHVGARLANGERPHDVMKDLLSPANMRQLGDDTLDGYVSHVKELFPLIDDETGQARKHEDYADHFKQLTREYMDRRHGSQTGAFHSQDLGVDSKDTHEAMYRSLADHPEAPLAFKAPAELSASERHQLRQHFYKMQLEADKSSQEADASQADERKAAQTALEAHTRDEPEKEERDMFGQMAPTQAHREWAARKDSLTERLEGLKQEKTPLQELAPEMDRWRRQNADWNQRVTDIATQFAGRATTGTPTEEQIDAQRDQAVQSIGRPPKKPLTPWGRFVEMHGSLELATSALQDQIKGKFVRKFVDHYGRVTGKGLKYGTQQVRNSERHVQAIATRSQQAAIREEQRSIYAKVRKREDGKFGFEGGEGSVKQKYTKWLEEDTIAQQNQMAAFGASETERTARRDIVRPGERHTIGEMAEAQLGSMMPHLGASFEPGKPIGLFPEANMDGDRVLQQRTIKMFRRNGGRLGGWLGTGAGKSAISIGAFTEAHAAGEAKHGLYVVPSAVQEQFGGEMAVFTEPGQYRWKTAANMSHDQRVDLLRNPDMHMRVMTHQSFRETAMKLMEDHHGLDRAGLQAKLQAGDHAERAQMMRDAFDANDIPRQFLYWDEAHGGTHRGGGDPTGLSMIKSITSHPTNSTHAMLGTATPVKNDTTELHAMASDLDPERYHDRHQFMQQFGHDLEHAPDALRRELSHLTISGKIPPSGVERLDSNNPSIVDGKKVEGGGKLKLEPAHQELVDTVLSDYHSAREAHRRGDVDVEAVKRLSPNRFDGVPAEEHEDLARELGGHLGIVRESAMRRAINRAPPEINTKLKRLTEVVKHDIEKGTWVHRKTGETHTGKPAIVFTDSAAEARMIHAHLAEQGVRSGMYHGGLSPDAREKVRRGMKPPKGEERTLDVVVATAAMEAGVNSQDTKVVHHFDRPLTEKSHNQRSGRAYRQGQNGNVDVHDWITDTDFDARATRRLQKKTGLASVWQDNIASMDERGIAARYAQKLAHRHQGADSALAAK